MDLKTLQKRALKIRRKYEQLEVKRYGKPWSNEQLIEGFVKDVNDLFKLIKKNNINQIDHELSDCLWSVFVLANKYNIDLEKSFSKNMTDLENKIEEQLKI